MTNKKIYVLANFGGPRHLDEIRSFLQELLLDRDVIRTPLPRAIHNKLFKKIAKYRSQKIREDYKSIGGKSPIYEDTEWVANQLEEKLNAPVFAFHRYLPSTHTNFFEQLRKIPSDCIEIFPMFPQFCYSTTGSIANFFAKNLSPFILKKISWVQSYADHYAYVRNFQKVIRNFLEKNQCAAQDTLLLFSAHGIPQKFVNQGDPYQQECEKSFNLIRSAFPNFKHLLSYQSKFGPGKWIKPYTSIVSTQIKNYLDGQKQVVVIPLSFTSDHIETLYEIENLYLTKIRESNIEAFRCPALNRDLDWIDNIVEIMQNSNLVTNDSLIRS